MRRRCEGACGVHAKEVYMLVVSAIALTRSSSHAFIQSFMPSVSPSFLNQ